MRNGSLLGGVVLLAMVATMAQAQEKMNEAEWASASQLLADTAKMIEENGWQQGALEAVSQDCMATALEKAFRANPKYTLVDLNYAKAIFNDVIGAKDIGVFIIEDANAKDEPAVPYWGLEYMNWNDDPNQTEEKVIGTIMEASGKAAELSKLAATGQ